ncbi:MAG: ribosome maturation factor RimM [Methylobacteriaceae bacterium]|nr:ribosome maturation factor RimM [Methylobacteriaceae bacterium]
MTAWRADGAVGRHGRDRPGHDNEGELASDHILLAVFGAPHGVKGELRLKSFAGDSAGFDAYGPLVDRRGRRFEIVSKRPLKDDMFVVRVKGVGDRDAAQALTNLELFVPRAALPAADEGEFYYADLIGLAAETAAGARVGRIVGVENHGAGDILEIAPEAGGETLLLPFADAFVPTVDLAAGRVVVVLPEIVEGEKDRNEAGA